MVSEEDCWTALHVYRTTCVHPTTNLYIHVYLPQPSHNTSLIALLPFLCPAYRSLICMSFLTAEDLPSLLRCLPNLEPPKMPKLIFGVDGGSRILLRFATDAANGATGVCSSAESWVSFVDAALLAKIKPPLCKGGVLGKSLERFKFST